MSHTEYLGMVDRKVWYCTISVVFIHLYGDSIHHKRDGGRSTVPWTGKEHTQMLKQHNNDKTTGVHRA